MVWKHLERCWAMLSTDPWYLMVLDLVSVRSINFWLGLIQVNMMVTLLVENVYTAAQNISALLGLDEMVHYPTGLNRSSLGTWKWSQVNDIWTYLTPLWNYHQPIQFPLLKTRVHGFMRCVPYPNPVFNLNNCNHDSMDHITCCLSFKI